MSFDPKLTDTGHKSDLLELMRPWLKDSRAWISWVLV